MFLEYENSDRDGRIVMLWDFLSNRPCVCLSVFAGTCIVGYNEMVFGCCQPGSTRARCVFGYLRADVEPGSHDTQSTLGQAL